MSSNEYIKVKVRLLGNLRRKYERVHGKSVKLPKGSTILSLIDQIGIKKGEPKLIMVNGKDQNKSYTLENKDIVTLFPMILG